MFDKWRLQNVSCGGGAIAQRRGGANALQGLKGRNILAQVGRRHVVVLIRGLASPESWCKARAMKLVSIAEPQPNLHL